VEAHDSLPEPQSGDVQAVTLAQARAHLHRVLMRAEAGPIELRGPDGTVLGAFLSPADLEFFRALEDANDVAASRAALDEPGESVPLAAIRAELGL
jgi:hypothetical protein